MSLASLAILAAGCGGGGSTPVKPAPTPPPTTIEAVKALVAEIDAAKAAESLLPLFIETPAAPTFFDARFQLWAKFEEENSSMERIAKIHYFTDEQMLNPAGEMQSTEIHFPGGNGFLSTSSLVINAGPMAGTHGSTDGHETETHATDEAEIRLEVTGLGKIVAAYGEEQETSIVLTRLNNAGTASYKAPMNNGTEWEEYTTAGLNIRLERQGETNITGTITGTMPDLPAQIATTVGSADWQVTWHDGAKSTIKVR